MSDDNDSASLDPAPRCGSGGRRQGIPNYNNRILIPIIEEILPNVLEAWRLVAAAYKEQSGEDCGRKTTLSEIGFVSCVTT